LKFYFRDDHVGLVKDIRKLDAVEAPNKWLMAFVYPAPDRVVWDAVVSGLPTALQHWRPVDSPRDTDLPIHISLWRPESVGAIAH